MATATPAGPRSAADESGQLPRGATVGRFVLLGTLGHGGMGVVYAAHDPELDRKVALKLLLPRAGGTASTEGPTRLMREAQALAKLSHPNVVAVHDVGTHADSVWIAMEFVAGQTLTEWAEARPRRWTEVLPILADIARGVAAAHAAGLVHRDLKPDNVMIGADGRVRVMDFGLAHGRGAAVAGPARDPARAPGPAPELERSTLASRLTAAGAVQGTPAYMAPEQWQGQEAEPATDQFGWSVMAWELLYGVRPFSGDSMVNLATAVTTGQRQPPPRGRRVPGWLRRVIERGLAEEPARRWPTMAELLAALERGRSRARLRTVAAALTVLTLLAAGAEGYRRWDLARRVTQCEASGAEIDAIWTPDARQRLRAAFLATGLNYAATTADRVIPALDQRAAAWKQARTDVCLNADVRGQWGEDLADRALWCLEDRQTDIASLVDELARASATTVQKAVGAVGKLRAVDACLDTGLMLRQPAPPTGERAAIREVRAALSRAQSLSLAGDFKAALAVATTARERAGAVPDWPPLLAAAHAREGNLLEKTGAYEAAEAASAAAYFEASSAEAWEVAAAAASDLIYTVGYKGARPREGLVWARHAAMALVHAGDQDGLWEAQRLSGVASVQYRDGANAEARAAFERALAIRERALGPEHPEVATSLSNLAVMLKESGAFAEARALNQRALAIREQALGPDHPDVAMSLNNLALVHKAMGELAEARALNQRALAIREAALGPDHPDVSTSLNNLAIVHGAMGAHDLARPLFERALAILERTLGPDHPDVGLSRIGLANGYTATGEYAKALPLLELTLANQEKAMGKNHYSIAISLNSLADLYLETGEYAKARAQLERAITVQEQAKGPDHRDVARSLELLGQVLLAEDRPADALPVLERAMTIFVAHDGIQPGETSAQFQLARALVAAGGDRARALTLARAAEAGFQAAGAGGAEELTRVQQWLATQEHKE